MALLHIEMNKNVLNMYTALCPRHAKTDPVWHPDGYEKNCNKENERSKYNANLVIKKIVGKTIIKKKEADVKTNNCWINK